MGATFEKIMKIGSKKSFRCWWVKGPPGHCRRAFSPIMDPAGPLVHPPRRTATCLQQNSSTWSPSPGPPWWAAGDCRAPGQRLFGESSPAVLSRPSHEATAGPTYNLPHLDPCSKWCPLTSFLYAGGHLGRRCCHCLTAHREWRPGGQSLWAGVRGPPGGNLSWQAKAMPGCRSVTCGTDKEGNFVLE